MFMHLLDVSVGIAEVMAAMQACHVMKLLCHGNICHVMGSCSVAPKVPAGQQKPEGKGSAIKVGLSRCMHKGMHTGR